MKKIKILTIVLLTFVAIFYLAFLFILPNVINLNNYKNDINKLAKDSVNLDVKYDNLKLITTPLLKIGVKAQNLSVNYDDENEFLSVQNSKILLNVLPLVVKTISFDEVSLDGINLNLKILSDGQLYIQKYINDYLSANQTQEENDGVANNFPFKFSYKMPDICILNYNINLTDEKLVEPLSIKGQNFNLKDFKLNEKAKIDLKGKVLSEQKTYLDYDIKLDTILPEFNFEQNKDENETQEPINIGHPFYNLVQYDFYSNINGNLKIKNDKRDKIHLDGYFNIDNLNFVLNGKNIDNNYLKMNFDKNKTQIDSNLFVNEKDKISLNAMVKHGKKSKVSLNFEALNIKITDIKNIIDALAKIANVDLGLEDFLVNGVLNSKLNVDSNLKQFNSNGYFAIENANIKHKTLPLAIVGINSNVDFSNNQMDIKNTYALINGAKFIVKGNIDKNAFANINVMSEKLYLSTLFEAFAPKDLKKNYKINSGDVEFNALIKGNLDNINPIVKFTYNDFKLSDVINNISLTSKEGVLNIKSDLKDAEGFLSVPRVYVVLSDLNSNVKVMNLNVNMDKNKINIKPFDVFINNSPVSFEGEIKNYQTKPDIKIKGKGRLNAYDIKSFIPKEFKSMVNAKGALPVLFELCGDGVKNKIDFQILANASNNLNFININELYNKSSLLNISLLIDGNELNLDNTGLYKVNSNLNVLSDSVKDNLHHSNKFIYLSGKISDLYSKYPKINNIKINTPNEISFSLPQFSNSSILVKTDININGKLQSPLLGGYIKILNANIPQLKIGLSDLNVTFNGEEALINCADLNLNDSKFNFTASINSLYDKILTINSLNVSSNSIDVDKLFEIMNNLSKIQSNGGSSNASSSNAFDLPIKITNGRSEILKFKMGNIVATNIKSDFSLSNNIFYLSDLTATAFDGKINMPKVSYNLRNTNTNVKIVGRALNANDAIYATVLIKDQVKGTLDFNANLNLRGVDFNTQMKTLKGNANFLIKNGQLGDFGTFEHFLYAQNLSGISLFKSNLANTLRTIAPKNSGEFDYLKGNVSFSNGWMSLDPVSSSGKNMSLFIDGKMNLLNNDSNIELLGCVSNEIASSLGPLNDMSVSKLIANVGKFGTTMSGLLNSYNQSASVDLINKIPKLTPESDNSKYFKVKINGNIQSPTSVKYFKWLMTKSDENQAQSVLSTLGINVKFKTQEEVKTQLEQSKQQVINETSQKAKEVINKALPNFLDNLQKNIKQQQQQQQTSQQQTSTQQQ